MAKLWLQWNRSWATHSMREVPYAPSSQSSIGKHSLMKRTTFVVCTSRGGAPRHAPPVHTHCGRTLWTHQHGTWPRACLGRAVATSVRRPHMRMSCVRHACACHVCASTSATGTHSRSCRASCRRRSRAQSARARCWSSDRAATWRAARLSWCRGSQRSAWRRPCQQP